jgi:hypothetical protein
VRAVGRAYHKVNRTEMNKLLRSPDGAVARDVLRRSLRVASAAKMNLNSSPRRVNTGRLRASIIQRIEMRGGKPIGRIGTNVRYARMVHDGTGIYGPRGAMIVPKRAKALRWTKSGKTVFSMRSRGMRPNHYLKDALSAARG